MGDKMGKNLKQEVYVSDEFESEEQDEKND